MAYEVRMVGRYATIESGAIFIPTSGKYAFVNGLGHRLSRDDVVGLVQQIRLPGDTLVVALSIEGEAHVSAAELAENVQLVYEAARDAKSPPRRLVIYVMIGGLPPDRRPKPGRENER